MGIAEEIRALLGRTRTTYALFAQQTGISESTLRRKIEHEESPLNLVPLKAGAHGVGVCCSEVVPALAGGNPANLVNEAREPVRFKWISESL